jgi:serine/threonine protein kinase
MNPELLRFHEQIVTCKIPEDLFGQKITEAELKSLYRRFAAIAHVDKYQRLDEQRIAHLAFSKLNDLHRLALDKFLAGIYGTSKVVPKKNSTPPSMRSKKGIYIVKSGLAGGDVSSVYLGEFEGHTPVVMKIAAHHTLNDFLALEACMLVELNAAAAGTVSYKQFIPTILDAFQITIDGSIRRVNVFPYAEGFRPLTEITAQYPTGVDVRHFVWIFNRLLTVLSFAHSQGLVHGAVLPTHVLIHPITHAILLVDWCFTTQKHRPLLAVSKGYSHWYPPEVTNRQPITPATDLYMAAMCMSYILGADFGLNFDQTRVHPKFRRLLESCLIKNQHRRAQNAWETYKEFGTLAEEIFGPRQYVKLQLT